MIMDAVKKFFNAYKEESLQKGELLAIPNIANHPVYYLERGHVRQYVTTKDGKEMTLTIYKPGTFFPMMESLQTYANQYEFICVDDVSVRKAQRDEVIVFLKANPDILFDLLTRVYRGIEGLLSNTEQLMGGTATTRLVTALLIAVKRFGKQQNDAIEITLKLTHQDLADLTGLTRETVSRLMAELKKSNILTYSNTTISITSLPSLEKLLT